MADAFVGGLDLKGLGRKLAGRGDGGRSAYSPRVLLKLHAWGHRNGAGLSRRLMSACSTGVEAMWLACGLRPDGRHLREGAAVW